ncbi:MAG: hypothetical protein D6820_09335, partial [Lentisphaerae bacterium]
AGMIRWGLQMPLNGIWYARRLPLLLRMPSLPFQVAGPRQGALLILNGWLLNGWLLAFLMVSRLGTNLWQGKTVSWQLAALFCMFHSLYHLLPLPHTDLVRFFQQLSRIPQFYTRWKHLLTHHLGDYILRPCCTPSCARWLIGYLLLTVPSTFLFLTGMGHYLLGHLSRWGSDQGWFVSPAYSSVFFPILAGIIWIVWMMFLIVRKWLIHQPFYQQPDASVIASVIAGIVALCLDLGLAWLHPGYREVGATLFICSLILAIVQIGWQLRNLSPWRGYLPLWRGEWLFSLQLILLLNLLSWTLPVPNRYQLFLASAGIVWIFLTPVLMLSFPYPSGVLQGCWRLGRIAFILSQVTALGILSLKMLGLIYGGEFPSAPLFLWPCIFLGNAGLTGLSVLGRLGCPHPQGMVTAREQEALQRLHVIVNHIILRLANGLELLFGPRIIKKFQKAMARRLGEEDFSLGDTMFTDASRLYTQEELAAIIIEAYLILKAWYGTAFARNSLHNVLLSVSDEDLCLVKTQLFAHKPDFWQQIANRPASCNLSRKERISLLRQCFLLQPLSETQLSTVNSCFHEITLENGSVWVTSGDVLESFYIIARGAMSL